MIRGSMVQWTSASNQINDSLNQWINESMNERATESMNQWVNGQWFNDSVSQLMTWFNDSVSQLVNESMNQWINESLSESVKESMNHCINEPSNQMNQWINEFCQPHFAKSAPIPVVFCDFKVQSKNIEVQTKPSLQSSAHFTNFISQKCSDPTRFLHFEMQIEL